MAASNELLEQLHEAVGKQLLERILEGEAKASDFAQAIKFLSDNNIEASKEDSDILSSLEGSIKNRLPFTSADDFTH